MKKLFAGFDSLSEDEQFSIVMSFLAGVVVLGFSFPIFGKYVLGALGMLIAICIVVAVLGVPLFVIVKGWGLLCRRLLKRMLG